MKAPATLQKSTIVRTYSYRPAPEMLGDLGAVEHVESYVRNHSLPVTAEPSAAAAVSNRKEPPMSLFLQSLRSPQEWIFRTLERWLGVSCDLTDLRLADDDVLADLAAGRE